MYTGRLPLYPEAPETRGAHLPRRDTIPRRGGEVSILRVSGRASAIPN